jgi:hypothetical protein
MRQLVGVPRSGADDRSRAGEHPTHGHVPCRSVPTQEALRVSNETNAELLGKLTSLDTRLSAIEKTLNDVA